MITLEQWLRAMTHVVAHQADKTVHPLTCGNDSRHANLIPYWDAVGERVNLCCADCNYVQRNLAMFEPDKPDKLTDKRAMIALRLIAEGHDGGGDVRGYARRQLEAIEKLRKRGE